jgi:hypothetical protein
LHFGAAGVHNISRAAAGALSALNDTSLAHNHELIAAALVVGITDAALEWWLVK